MNLGDLVKDFEDEFLEWWDGTDWQPNVLKGSFQAYDRFITERTFGVKKRIFLSSSSILPTHVIVRTSDLKICLIESATPDYENGQVIRHSLLLRETNSIAVVTSTVPVVNASGVATGRADAVTVQTWGDLDRYNSNQSSEFPGVVHETDILVVPPDFPVVTDSKLVVNGVAYKVAEIGRVLRLKELRVRRGD